MKRMNKNMLLEDHIGSLNEKEERQREINRLGWDSCKNNIKEIKADTIGEYSS